MFFARIIILYLVSSLKLTPLFSGNPIIYSISSYLRKNANMKIGLLGYGRMGKAVEEEAKARGHEIMYAIDMGMDDAYEEMLKNQRREACRDCRRRHLSPRDAPDPGGRSLGGRFER